MSRYLPARKPSINGRYDYDKKQRDKFKELLDGGNDTIGITRWKSCRYAGVGDNKCKIVIHDAAVLNLVSKDRPRMITPYQASFAYNNGWLPKGHTKKWWKSNKNRKYKKNNIELSHTCGVKKCIIHLLHEKHSTNLERKKHHQMIEQMVRKTRQERIKLKKTMRVPYRPVRYLMHPIYHRINHPNGCKHNPTCFKNYQCS